MRLPPATMRPPVFLASSTRPSTRSSCALLFSGPHIVPSLRPSPTWGTDFFARSASASTIWSYCDSCTKTRLMAMQTWPVLNMAPPKIFGAAFLTLVPGRTIAASLPPSSRVTFFSCGAPVATILLPVAAEPVKDTCLTSGCSTIIWPSWSPPERMLTTPAGKAFAATAESMTVVSGVYGDGLTMTVLPVITAGRILLQAMSRGKFQGVMPPTTPRGK
mmetsp:Transcript_90293/g.269376  ORF Transcript_90293/g.269376 Transcript_90293/m.269376 type:complete len:218 (-) Transcript_90293:540-1193(-)